MRVALALLLFLQLLPSAAAAKKVALVIGNSAYVHSPRLANPRNDAADVSAALRKLGFEVVDGLDLGKAAFERKIRDFAAVLGGTESGVFFYAGHGLQVGGQNYLVPIDAQLSTPDALDFEMVKLEIVQRTMERESATNVIFLDACRNNPLARNLARAMGTRSAEIGRGLAPMESGVGTLISFSTQPGNVALDGTGRNSPFAGALITQLAQSSDDLSAMLIAVRNDVMKETRRRQVPWEHSALTGRFYFKQPRVAPPLPAADEVAWALIRSSKDAAIFGRFIEQFPDSTWRGEAEKQAAALAARAKPADKPPQPKPPPTPVAAPAPGQPPDEVAWSLIKDTRDAGLLRRFVEQFPRSSKRAEAEKRAADVAAAAPAQPKKTTRSKQNCFTFQGREFCQ